MCSTARDLSESEVVLVWPKRLGVVSSDFCAGLGSRPLDLKDADEDAEDILILARAAGKVLQNTRETHIMALWFLISDTAQGR